MSLEEEVVETQDEPQVDLEPVVDGDVEVDVENNDNEPDGVIEDVVVVPEEFKGSPDYSRDIQELRERTIAAEARAMAAENIHTQGLNARDRAEQEQAERERIMSMTPDERALYIIEQGKNDIQRELDVARRQIADANDRAEYAALKAKNKMAEKYEAEVEARLREAHSAGYKDTKRQAVLTYIAGEKALAAAASGATSQQREKAKENIQSSQAKPTASSGDQGGAPERVDENSREARNERLRNRGR